jgi:hypothetical protein
MVIPNRAELESVPLMNIEPECRAAGGGAAVFGIPKIPHITPIKRPVENTLDAPFSTARRAAGKSPRPQADALGRIHQQEFPT